jgi:HK97 family phage major capsid protein
MEPNSIKEYIATELKRIGGEFTAFASARKESEGEIKARLLQVEQSLARPRGAIGVDLGGGGDHLAELQALIDGSAELRSVFERKSKRAVLELPAQFFNTKVITTGVSATTGLGVPDRLPGIQFEPVRRRMTIRALIPSIPTVAGSVQYTQETSFDNQAAPVSETIEKAQSNIVFALKNAPIATIAHWIRTSVQVLADTPQLMLYIDGRLRYGLAYAEELQLLKGSGVGANIQGMMGLATAYNRTTALDTKADVLRRACTQLELTDFQASGIVLNPADWEAICLLKSTTGEYIVEGGPEASGPPVLWGLPVVPTNAMTLNNFLVADFGQAAIVFDRMAPRIDVSTETDDDFITNQCHIRGEERLGLAVPRPGGLIKGTFP